MTKRFMILITAIVLVVPVAAFAYTFQQVQVQFNGSSLANMLNAQQSWGIDLNMFPVGALQAAWTGSPNGSLGLQVSNDIVAVGSGDPAANVANWSTYTGSATGTNGSAGNFLYNLVNLGYRWVRLTYSNPSGAGSLAAVFVGKGN